MQYGKYPTRGSGDFERKQASKEDAKQDDKTTSNDRGGVSCTLESRCRLALDRLLRNETDRTEKNRPRAPVSPHWH